jgi:hypothetical protein
MESFIEKYPNVVVATPFDKIIEDLITESNISSYTNNQERVAEIAIELSILYSYKNCYIELYNEKLNNNVLT